MKLLLTSTGFSTEEIIKALEELVGKSRKDISVAVINEGFVPENVDKRWVIEELNKIASTCGGELDIVNLLALPKDKVKERMQNKDVIYVLGGHTDYLMHVLNRTGFTQLLPELLKEKVYVGSSAGSMVVCRRISTDAYQESYGEEGTYGTERYLELADFAIKPHMDSPHFPKSRRENLIRVSETFESIIYALRDDQAIAVNEKEIKIVNGPILTLQKGKEV